MVSSLPVDSIPSVIEKRSNPRLRKTLIARARHFLEKTYFSKLQSEVWRNLGRGKLGEFGFTQWNVMYLNHINIKNIISHFD
jgi:hypothetical protein